jgi:hypothetical protein
MCQETCRDFSARISERFSRTTNFNITFACRMVKPVGKTYDGVVPRASPFTATKEVTSKQGTDILTRAFSYDVAQITSLFLDHVNNPGQCGSVKGLYSNDQQYFSVASQRLDNCSFVGFL